MSNPYVLSLKRRIRAMNALWQRAVDDVTLEQVNHHERPGVLTIAFSLSHALPVQDIAIRRNQLGAPLLWEQGAWAGRIGATVDRMGTGVPVSEMELLRFADLAAWREYQSECRRQTSS